MYYKDFVWNYSFVLSLPSCETKWVSLFLPPNSSWDNYLIVLISFSIPCQPYPPSQALIAVLDICTLSQHTQGICLQLLQTKICSKRSILTRVKIFVLYFLQYLSFLPILAWSTICFVLLLHFFHVLTVGFSLLSLIFAVAMEYMSSIPNSSLEIIEIIQTSAYFFPFILNIFQSMTV